ncbi:MAG: ABC transporter permease [Mycobacteriales bacterium]
MTGVELAKQLRRPRTWVTLLVVCLLPVLITIAFKVGGGPHHHGRDAGLFSVATRSGLNMPLAALTGLQGFLLVIVVALFAGESLAGEANWGSLRYLLVRPVGRARLLSAKLGVSSLLCLVAVVLVPISGSIAGVLAFGWHPVITPSLTVISAGSALGRLAISTAYVAWSMTSVIAFALLLSTFTTSPFGSVLGGVGFAVVSEILDAIPAFGSLRYGLPTHYWQAWNGLFAAPTQTSDMIRGALLQLPYAAVFLAVAYFYFTRKDVLS